MLQYCAQALFKLWLRLSCQLIWLANTKNNLLNVITYRCLWKNQRNSAQISDKQCSLYNKRVCPIKNEPQQQGISYLAREREGVRERDLRAGRSAARHIKG
jgi:hypothetical protein